MTREAGSGARADVGSGESGGFGYDRDAASAFSRAIRDFADATPSQFAPLAEPVEWNDHQIDFTRALRAIPSRDAATFEISWDESDPSPTHHLPGDCHHTGHDPAGCRGFIGSDELWPLGCEQRPVGTHGDMRGVGPERSSFRVFRHLRKLMDRIQRGPVLANCWGSDVGRAGRNRDGDRGPSARRGEL